MTKPHRCQRNIPDKGPCRNRNNLLFVEGLAGLGFSYDSRWFCESCVGVLMDMLGQPTISHVENLTTGEIRSVSPEGHA